MWRELESGGNNSMKSVTAFVLAGGFGMRLRPAFDGPKALAPVLGKPFLHFVLQSLRRGGVPRVVLCVGYKHELIRRWIANTSIDLDIGYSLEPKPLGTGGALALAVERFGNGGTLLAMNGDSFVKLNFTRMLELHVLNSASATVGITEAQDTGRYGQVETDEKGWVLRFSEKQSNGRAGFINSGVYLFETEVVRGIPAGRDVSLEHEVLPSLVNQRRVIAFPAEGGFIDIGTPEDYSRSESHMRQVLRTC